jgi:hypothetical protein
MFSSLQDIIRAAESWRIYGTRGESGNAYIILVGKPDRKWSLLIYSRKWTDNIKLGGFGMDSLGPGR